MCFSSGRSLWVWKESCHPHPLFLPEAEVDEACTIWEQSIWPMLDHSRNYCMSAQELIKAILREKHFPAVPDRWKRREYSSHCKDSDVSARLRDVFRQSPATCWRGDGARSAKA